MNHPPHLSVVSPVYGAATLLSQLVERIHTACSQITNQYEIILVEDHSPDNSWERIIEISQQDPKVKGISLSRNFGQQNALNAGLDHAQGEWIVTMDCDLQDNPDFIIDMYRKGQQGYDIVFASRQNRQDGWMKKTGSRLFYRTLSFLTETEQDHTVANFILYHRKAVDAMKSLGDYYRYYPMLNQWIGFNTTKLEVPHAKRTDNIESSYSLKKRMRLAFTTIIAFSDKPLRLVLKFGIMVVFLTMIIAMALVIRYFTLGTSVSGWLSVFLSIWFLSGIIILILGLIGVYLGRMFESIKHRPTYLIKNKTF